MWPQAPAWGPGRSRFTSSVGAKDGSEESFAPHGAIPSIATHSPRWRVGPHSVAAARLYSDALRAISWTALVIDRRYSSVPHPLVGPGGRVPLEFSDGLAGGLSDVNGAPGINRDHVGSLETRHLLDNLSVFEVDHDHILSISSIDDVHHVVFRDEYPIRRSGIGGLADVFAVLIEDLDALVGAVSNIQQSLGVHRDAVWNVQLTRPGAFHAPEFDQFAVL